MADLIERNAAMRMLSDYAETQQDLDYYRDMLMNIPAVNRWIPCSERLPVLYVPVMILTDDGSYAIAHVTGNEDEYLWFGDGGHYSKDYVLFWMPLPEPPEKERYYDKRRTYPVQ